MNIHLRTNRDGSQVWRLEVYVKDGDQVRRRVATVDVTIERDKGRARAEIQWANLRAETLRQIRQGVDPDKQHLGAYLTKWLQPENTPALRPKTRTDYLYTMNHYVIPELGNIPLARLNRKAVQALWDRLGAEGRVRTAHKARTILRKALQDAWREGLVADNVVDPTLVRVKAPPPRREIFNVDQVEHLVEAAIATPDNAPQAKTLGNLIAVAAYSGLRLGELTGLQWGDWDPAGHTLFVRRSVTLDGGKARVQDQTKTPAGRRFHVLTDQAQDALQRQWEHLRPWEIHVNGLTSESGWIFPSLLTGQYFHPRYITRYFERARDQAGLPRYSFHSLRHFYASWAAYAGVPMEVAAKQMGHQTSQITREVYSHVLPEGSQENAQKMSKWLATRHAKGEAKGAGR